MPCSNRWWVAPPQRGKERLLSQCDLLVYLANLTPVRVGSCDQVTLDILGLSKLLRGYLLVQLLHLSKVPANLALSLAVVDGITQVTQHVLHTHRACRGLLLESHLGDIHRT